MIEGYEGEVYYCSECGYEEPIYNNIVFGTMCCICHAKSLDRSREECCDICYRPILKEEYKTNKGLCDVCNSKLQAYLKLYE